MLSQAHTASQATLATLIATRLERADSSAREGERRGGIVSKRTLYLGILAAGAWNMFAVGSPLWSLAGIFTLLVNIGVGATFLWILLEPPYLYAARRDPRRRVLGRHVSGFSRLRLPSTMPESHSI